MKKIVFYLLAICAAYLWCLYTILVSENALLDEFRLPLTCAVVGGLAGVLYCIRAVYLNVAVHKNWSEEWHVWYLLRPLASFGCGAVSYVFLRAGLLFLESDVSEGASEFGFYALAFVAGLNVDKFIQKIEGVGEAVWGIEKTRSRKRAEKGSSE